MALSAHYTDGDLEIRQGRNAWRVKGAAWVPGLVASMKARGCDPGGGRILGRLLHRRYPGVEIERTARESAADRHERRLREDPGSAEIFAAEIARRAM